MAEHTSIDHMLTKGIKLGPYTLYPARYQDQEGYGEPRYALPGMKTCGILFGSVHGRAVMRSHWVTDFVTMNWCRKRALEEGWDVDIVDVATWRDDGEARVK